MLNLEMNHSIQFFFPQTLPYNTRHFFSNPPKPKFKFDLANLNNNNNTNTRNPTIPELKAHGETTSTQFHEPSSSSKDDLLSSYCELIQGCISSNSFERGKIIHSRMLSVDGFKPNTFLQTKILMLYARAGGLSDLCTARRLFDDMPERNSTCWNTMILAYARVGDHKQVLEMFSRMLINGFSPDRFTFPSVVKAFVAFEDYDGLRDVYNLIYKSGLHRHSVVGRSLVEGYVSFGLVDDAAAIFNEIDEKDVVSWNVLITGYERIARWEEAWDIFYEMVNCGKDPSEFTFASTIKLCGSAKSLARGKQVHAKLIVCGYEGDVFVGNSLIDMYVKCRDFEESYRQVFNHMGQKDQVTWNSIISGSVHLGYFSEALMMFSRMQMLGYQINRFNLGSVLEACAGLAEVEASHEVHAYLVRHYLDDDVNFGSPLVNVYVKCGLLEKAHRAFKRLVDKNEVAWDTLISGYVRERKQVEALKLYHEMKGEMMQCTRYTFTSLLSLFADEGMLYHGKQIHAHMIRTVGTKHLIVETELVHMYVKCRNLNYAQEIFNRMPERNGYTWNSLIEGYEQNEQPEKALQLFQEMQLVGISPDCFSLTSAISACKKLSDVKKGKEVHGFLIRKGLQKQGILQTVLVDMYTKSGFMDYACKIYSSESVKDVSIQNVMISAYVGCSRFEDAKQVFERMEERNTISWNSILVGCAKFGSEHETFKFFRRMQEEDIEFDSLTMVTLFSLCANLPALAQGEQLHVLAIKKGFVNTSVVMDSTLIDMYSKCGSIEQARRVFDMMEEKNIISWNGMINGYAKHGISEEVLVLYEEMQKQGIYPNSSTYVSVLSACSHTGQIEEGLRIFISMVEDHRLEVKAEHYTCMVDLLGRAGLLDEAKEVIEKMPVKPEISTWGALLGACKVHQNVELGRIAADHLFDMDPENPGHYVLMSNIYAVARRWKEVDEVRNLMRARGVIKDPGISWIEINNEIQTFQAGAQTHHRTDEIYKTLRHLSLKMKGLGYIPDTKFVLRNVSEVEEEEYLMQHSERLAIALGLISLPKKSTIRVFKNLRICGDCHTAAKLISKISGRKIVVRDINRFHHFENGVCSCGNFW